MFIEAELDYINEQRAIPGSDYYIEDVEVYVEDKVDWINEGF